ncbi:MAG: hypothetical protein M1497_00685 [Nitrospirae bacterium]|nr:hypothetical protein [Nitrospirota bacterium]
MTRKMNCWEFMKCGRELDGEKAKEFGVCPAATYPYADGLNGGINGGRICWVIVGSYSCHTGKTSLARKKNICFDCKFHEKVLLEEGIMDLRSKRKKMAGKVTAAKAGARRRGRPPR